MCHFKKMHWDIQIFYCKKFHVVFHLKYMYYFHEKCLVMSHLSRTFLFREQFLRLHLSNACRIQTSAPICSTVDHGLYIFVLCINRCQKQLYYWETIPENSKLFDFYPILSPWFWQQWTSYLRWYFNIKTNSGKQWSKLWKWNFKIL